MMKKNNAKIIEISFESNVADQLGEMSKFTKQDVSLLVNKAVKKFISQHKDYFPNGEKINNEED